MLMGHVRGLVVILFVLVVLALGALEVVALHSVRATEPMRSGPAVEAPR